ncbi:MAG TPA: TetR/AcrR family transcriptional regulator [Syntrophorhabdales bacterium]|nr:TetR/AcrR family transcriptional regulator [Syntrophorhabdales bacterium]
MKEKGRDRRIDKTRKVLQNALISLMKKKEYRSITIQEIIDEADVGRSTFYTHFDDKDDLLMAGMHDLRDVLEAAKATDQAAAARQPYERIIGFSLAMFEHAYAYREVYRALVRSQAGALVLQYFPALLAGLIRDEATKVLRGRPGKGKAVPADLLVHFISSAFVSVLSWWLDADKPMAAGEIDALFRALVLPTLASQFPGTC